MVSGTIGMYFLSYLQFFQVCEVTTWAKYGQLMLVSYYSNCWQIAPFLTSKKELVSWFKQQQLFTSVDMYKKYIILVQSTSTTHILPTCQIFCCNIEIAYSRHSSSDLSGTIRNWINQINGTLVQSKKDGTVRLI